MIPRDPNNPAYSLIPEDMVEGLPRLYATENDEDPVARLKFFTPDGAWTWYVMEYDPDQRLFFGLVIGHEREFGYFSQLELEAVRGPMGLPVERDLYFKPCPASQLVDQDNHG